MTPDDVRRQAAAVRYQSLGELPEVVASGSGEVADTIVRLAEEAGIPVHESRELVEQLRRLPPRVPVPPQTFRLVAEVISFLYAADEKWRDQHRFLDPVMEK